MPMLKNGKNSRPEGWAMPSLVCSTFDEFEAELIGFDGRYHLIGRDYGEWRSQAFSVGSVLVQLVSEGAACVYEGTTLHGWATLFVPRSPPHWYRMLGRPMDENNVIHFAPGKGFLAAVSNANQWLSLSAPAELLLFDARCEASAVRANRCLGLNPATIAALIGTLDRLAALDTSGRLPQEPISGILEGRLLALWRFALTCPVDHTPIRGRPSVSREKVFSTAVSLMNAWASRELRIDDLCKATGVSERTLRSVFNDQVGLGPHQYLQIQRLHRIRRALTATNPGKHTVAGIGARHGYWNGSRLAHDYRALFGELPSETLLRRFPQPV
jgi:AraC family transcriptional regulator, ethanolamine operon transcriptional activator